MSYPEVMRRALEDHDLETCRKLWAQVAPKMPQPKTEDEARIVMHYACTQAKNIRFKSRAYSHAWLCDHLLPSGLPDELKPKAQRIYPTVVDAVGIAVGFKSSVFKPLAPIIRGAMEDVVLNHYADGIKDPEIIRPRMLEARKNAVKKLIG